MVKNALIFLQIRQSKAPGHNFRCKLEIKPENITKYFTHRANVSKYLEFQTSINFQQHNYTHIE